MSSATSAHRPGTTGGGMFRSLNELCEDFRRRAGTEVSSADETSPTVAPRAAPGPPVARESAGAATCGAGTTNARRSEAGAATTAAGYPPAGNAAGQGAAGQGSSQLRTGTLKKLFREKGFGFVSPDGSSAADVFLHFSDLASGNSEAMIAGLRVRYRGEVDAQTGKVRARSANIIANNERRSSAPGSQPAVGKSDGAAAKAEKDVSEGKGRVEPASRRRAKDGVERIGEAANGATAEHTGQSPGGASDTAGRSPSAVGRAYSRKELLAVFNHCRNSNRLAGRPKSLRIRTLYMPWVSDDLSDDKNTSQRERPNDVKGTTAATRKKADLDEVIEEADEEAYESECPTEPMKPIPPEAPPPAPPPSAPETSAPEMSPLAMAAQDDPLQDYLSMPFQFADSDESDEDQDIRRARGLGGVVLQGKKRSSPHVEELDRSTAAGLESDAVESSASDSGLGGGGSSGGAVPAAGEN